MGGVSFGGAEGRRLTLEDAQALRDDSGGLLTVSPEAGSRQQVAYLRWNSNNQIAGVWPEFFVINDLELTHGRFFTRDDEERRRRVAVLGADLPDLLGTPPELLLGKSIQIGPQRVEVIGVLAEKGDRLSRADDRVFVPTSTGIYRLFGGRDRLSMITVSTASEANLEPAFQEIDRILKREHRIPPGSEADFTIISPVELMETFGNVAAMFGWVLGGLAGISLLVGGIGIMNIMLVSVTERTREIGVRRAMGAKRRMILLQFVVEAIVMCVLGGAIGVLLGYGGARLVSSFSPMGAVVSPGAVMMALTVSAGIGLFFGIWPAWRAARLDPINALRYE
jgi:putative ABC transport system permease protein